MSKKKSVLVEFKILANLKVSTHTAKGSIFSLKLFFPDYQWARAPFPVHPPSSFLFSALFAFHCMLTFAKRHRLDIQSLPFRDFHCYIHFIKYFLICLKPEKEVCFNISFCMFYITPKPWISTCGPWALLSCVAYYPGWGEGSAGHHYGLVLLPPLPRWNWCSPWKS